MKKIILVIALLLCTLVYGCSGQDKMAKYEKWFTENIENKKSELNIGENDWDSKEAGEALSLGNLENLSKYTEEDIRMWSQIKSYTINSNMSNISVQAKYKQKMDLIIDDFLKKFKKEHVATFNNKDNSIDGFVGITNGDIYVFKDGIKCHISSTDIQLYGTNEQFYYNIAFYE